MLWSRWQQEYGLEHVWHTAEESWNLISSWRGRESDVPLFTVAKAWKQPKCPWAEEWIRKMWYTYTTEYYSAMKKEWNNAIRSNMDGPRDYRTTWSKSDGGRQIPYDTAHMWNLKKWYKWTYLQNRNRLTDIKDKLMVTKGDRGGGGINLEFGISRYKLLYIK